ncbi:SAM-dependent methyltransferase [Shewanella waksmanii]|uniref:SAM-dependent methyltransferase n=1 Tax=Shewanella waksmanii TaxID=213783 RepID=UPI003735D402
MTQKKGSLVCVGTGMQLAGQITVLAKSYIESADIVFTLVPEAYTERWLKKLNGDVRSLQGYYAQEGEVKNRRNTYDEMVTAILTEVRNGQNVVCALYGHPGVFACVSHLAIEQAKEEGYNAQMLPGVSAEACLWADLGIDPGSCGHQSYEASQFMFFEHKPDPSTHLLLWQIGIAGEHTLTQFNTCSDKLQVLVEHLLQWYPVDHKVVLYEAASLPTQAPRIERISLSLLPQAQLSGITTLLIPPSQTLTYNEAVLTKLGITAGDLG